MSNQVHVSEDTCPPEQDTLVYVAFLRALSPHVDALAGGEALEDLAAALALRDARLADEVARIDMSAWSDTLELEIAHTRIFVRGQVPPYETAYLQPSIVGHVGELADIAGFYKAFGFEVSKERTDHLLVELEFAAFLAAKEAAAIAAGHEEGTVIVGSARRTFYQDHFGCWLNAYAAKLEEKEPGVPYTALVDLLASWVTVDCRNHGVMPRRPMETPGAGVFAGIDTDDNPLECMGCPAEEMSEALTNFLPEAGLPTPDGTDG
ncbi:MAG: molecular chaperone TorD family protein [Acidimicrobiia bacterium]|nr:molecular chaperone TorD family protein [Acidimicrobiia bacterium]